MAAHDPTTMQLPTIVKYVQSERYGVTAQNITRHAIGYVVRGTKFIYDGDRRMQVSRGEVFYLGPGYHYIEDIPETGRGYEQIAFHYSSVDLSQIISALSMSYGFRISNIHDCPECHRLNFSMLPPSGIMRNFFMTSDCYLRESIFAADDIAGKIKMTELIYLILSNSDSCFKTKILSGADTIRGSFEQIMREHIFSDISIESLAEKTNRSTTAFKMEFRRHFDQPPHRWFIHQRLMHSCLLLTSTNKTVAQIGDECNFPNTSHFIKLFKKEYGVTPASYRAKKAIPA